MRKLTDHIVPGAGMAELEILVMDEPGPGGANHCYQILGYDPESNPSAPAGADYLQSEIILFQNGPIKEVGVNGISNEALAAILIDRMRGFQSGPYAGFQDRNALACFSDGLDWLQRRTRDRLERGVEGTHEK